MATLTTERTSFESALSTLLSSYASGSSATIPSGRLTLINYVKAKVDEIIPEGEGTQFSLDDEDNITDPYNLLVNAFLDEAAKRVLLSAPLHVLDPVSNENEPVKDTGGDDTGYVQLADNFLRLVSFKMTDWEREVTEAITPQDARYKLQRNAFTRGGPAKPVVAFSRRTIDGSIARVLEYYSSATHEIEWFYYIRETEAEDMPDNLQDALTWAAAGMVLQVTGMAEQDKAAFAQEKLCYQNL